MAIPDAGKQFEAEWSGTDPRVFALTSTVKAGGLIVLFLGGRRSAAALSVVSVKDTKNNAYQIVQYPSTTRFCAIAWTRTDQPMGTADRITVDLSGGPGQCWASCHVFEGASDVAIGSQAGWNFNTNVSAVLPVTGSDWLTLGVFILPNDYGVTLTPVNSSISQDDNAHASVAPWIECFSRNGTTGSTHTIGGTAVAAVTFAGAAVSLPALALPGGGRSSSSVIWV